MRQSECLFLIINNAKEKKILHVFNILPNLLKKNHGVKNRLNYDH